MRKIIALLFAFIFLPTIARTESDIDYSALSSDDLEKLLVEASLEINQRKEIPTSNTEWSESDFVFYDGDGMVALRPISGTNGWISMKKIENGRTFRGLKLGDYPEMVKALYDFSDASWEIRDTESEFGFSDREKELTHKWTDLGYNGNDLLDQVPFLSAKGYGFLLNLLLYKEDGVFRTESQLTYSGLNLDENYIDEKGRNIGWYKKTYLQQHLRAKFMVSVFSGRVYAIELTDYYYSQLDEAYNDDGTVNEKYSYVFDLK